MSDLSLKSRMGPPVIDRQLITYAFLAQTNPKQGDLLSGLAPIVKPIARALAGQQFDAKDFSRRVEELYQISIHPWVADDLAPRLESAGLLVKGPVGRLTSYLYADIPQAFDEVSVGDIRQVLQCFVDYARPLLDRHKLELDDERLQETFLRELTSLDFHAALLSPRLGMERAEVFAAKTEEIRPVGIQDVAEQEALTSSNVSILCAGFILAMHQSKPLLYELILRIATGAMVAEAVLNFQNPSETASLKGLHIAFDGPFIMALLDLGDNNATAYANALCEQIRKQGAVLQVFSHSVDEVRAAIESTLRAFEAGSGKGALARRLGVRTYREYVKSVLGTLESTISRHQISILAAPTRRDSPYFSEADEVAMTEYLGHYENSVARERDAASIAAVMRIRRDNRVHMGRLHRAGIVFLTSNTRVADKADRFTVSQGKRKAREVPPAFTDRQLASLLFVMYGGQGRELTQYQLLANCAKALEPNNEVMQNMHRFLSSLDASQAAQFRAVMTEDRASQHLVQITLGDGCITSSLDATVILEQLEAQLGEENRRQFDERVAELLTQHEAQMDDIALGHQREVEVLRTEQKALASKLDEAEKQRIQDRFDLDEAIKSREAFKVQMKDIVDSRRQETKGKLELCAQYAYRRGEFRHREFSWGVVFVLLLCAFLLSGVISDDYKFLYIISTALSSGLGGLVFSRNPEKLLSAHFARVREAAYRSRAKELGIETDNKDFIVNLEKGTVELVQLPENAPNIQQD